MVLAATLLALVLVAAQAVGALEAQERALHDARQAARQTSAEEAREARILVVEVTDACVERYGSWPWPRSRLADLVETIARADAKVIAMDVLFPDAAGEEDVRLARTLSAAGNVVLAGEVVRRTAWDNTAGALATRLEMARPTPALDQAAAGVGFVNVDYFFENQDGVVRRLPLAIRLPDPVTGAPRTYGVLALEAVARYQGERPVLREGNDVVLGGWHLPVSPPPPSWGRSPLVEGSYLEIPFDASATLEYARGGDHGLIPTVRALDVLAGNVPEDRFHGRVVLLGLNVRGVDRKVTPVGHMAGVQIQAHLVRNLLGHRLLTRISRGGAAATLLAAVCFGVALGWSLAPAWALVAAAALAWLWLQVGRILFTRAQFQLDQAAPLLGMLLGLLLTQALAFWLRERRRVRNLETLHENGRRFSRTLELATLLEDVCERYRELLPGGPAAVVFRPSDSDAVESHFTAGFPPALRVALSRRRLQSELMDHLRVADVVVPATRLRELADCPPELELEGAGVVVPLGRFERTRGFVFVQGATVPPAAAGDESTFWQTHAAAAATALENAGLYRLATVDALTGLYLRHFFDSSLQREFSRAGRYRGHLALLLTDIDRFKVFNDTHGHQVGDRVLRYVAEKVRASVRGVDIACRYGGEEFAVILPETDYEGALLTAQRIRSTVEEAVVELEDKRLQVTISIGLACTDRSQAKGPEAFVDEADQALYQAKEAGRNRVVAWSPEGRGATTS